MVPSQSLAVRIIFTKVYFPKYYIHPIGMIKTGHIGEKKLWKQFRDTITRPQQVLIAYNYKELYKVFLKSPLCIKIPTGAHVT